MFKSMAVRYFALLLISISVRSIVFGQAQTEEIQKLQKIAIANEERAVKAEALAESYLQRAKVAEEAANRMRYIALANELTISSSQSEDRELAGLLALQANKLNIDNGNNVPKSRIYAAITNALKRYESHPKTLNSESGSSMVSNAKTNSVFSVGNDGRVMRWMKQNGDWKSEELLKIKTNGTIQAVDLSKDGNLIAVGLPNSSKSQTSYVEVINVAGQTKRVEGFAAKVEKIIFSTDGKGFYALCNSGRSIMYSDLNTANEVINSKEKILSMDLSSDGTKLIGAGALGNLLVWNTSDYASTAYKIFSDESGLSSISVIPNNQHLVIGEKNGELRLISLRDGQTVRALPGHYTQVTKIALSHSGSLMAAAGTDSIIRVWDLNSISQRPIVIGKSLIKSFVFSPDDTQILSATDAGINVWPLQISDMANELCGLIKRKLSKEEWETYVGPDLPYENTCPQ